MSCLSNLLGLIFALLNYKNRESSLGFSLNVNDMSDTVCSWNDANNTEKGELDIFADDTTTHEVGNTVDEALTKIQGIANKFFVQSYRNSLTIHQERCKILIVSGEHFVGPLQQVTINNKPIEFVNNSKCLGLTIDSKLSWQAHIQKLCKSFSGKIKNLYI